MSEGEKNFLTFLYFIYLTKGAHDKNNIKKDKIIVIDDPVSSLDSTSSFIISNFIIDIFNIIKENKSNIKQIFVLTHSIHFHKEISHKNNNNKHVKFFIIRKNNNITEIEDCKNKNPINNSYQLLWHEVKNNQINCVSTQNAMRRILENFCTFSGYKYHDGITQKFNSDEQIIVKSLFAWLNDGSHCIPTDDIDTNHIDDKQSMYKDIFKEIFTKMGYENHYKMMMGENKD